MLGTCLSPWPLALVLWAGTRSPASTPGQRGCRLGGCYPSMWEGGLRNLYSEQGGPWWGETAAWVRRKGWAVPSRGSPIPGPAAATYRGANLPSSCPRTYCLHKKLPCRDHGCGFSFPGGVWGPGDPTIDTGAPWNPYPHPLCSWSPPPGGPHTQAHCGCLRGVSGTWLLFPLVTCPQVTKRDSILAQFLFKQNMTLVRDGEIGAPA